MATKRVIVIPAWLGIFNTGPESGGADIKEISFIYLFIFLNTIQIEKYKNKMKIFETKSENLGPDYVPRPHLRQFREGAGGGQGNVRGGSRISNFIIP